MFGLFEKRNAQNDNVKRKEETKKFVVLLVLDGF